jgi:hypothetical protein
MTIHNNRFSIYLLEKDVLEYVNAKNKYNEYNEKYNSCSDEFRQEYKQKKNYWYKKYISKMKYLEENYRKTNVYTSYHSQLEHGMVSHNETYCVLPPIVHAEVIEATPILSCALPSPPPTLHVEPSAPLESDTRETPIEHVRNYRRRSRDAYWTPL